MNSHAVVDFPSLELTTLLQTSSDTPVLPIKMIAPDGVYTTYLKLEGNNPGGSIKMRTAYALVQDLEARGKLGPDTVVVESTSGNLGVAMSLFAKAKGFQFLAIVDAKTTSENIAKMRFLGAQIEIVDQLDRNGSYLLTRLDRVRELCASSSKYVWSDQYSNNANVSIHYTQTAPEIYYQMHEHVDAVFVAVSTGGTLAGIGKFFREVSPQTRIIGVDARGSVIFGTPPAERKLTGIGSSRTSNFLRKEHYDDYRIVGDEEAFAFCRALYAMEGILVGGSSGAVLAACAGYLVEHPNIKRSVCVCPDTGKNYSSSIFNDEWVLQQGLDLTNRLYPIKEITL